MVHPAPSRMGLTTPTSRSAIRSAWSRAEGNRAAGRSPRPWQGRARRRWRSLTPTIALRPTRSTSISSPSAQVACLPIWTSPIDRPCGTSWSGSQIRSARSTSWLTQKRLHGRSGSTSVSAAERLQAVDVNIRGQALMADEVMPFMGIQRTGGLVVCIAVDDDVSSALKTCSEPGVPASVTAAISPMTALAATRQVTLKVLPCGPPDQVSSAVVELATG